MTSRGKITHPDSLEDIIEDIIRDFGYVVETWGVVSQNKEYSEALQEALTKLSEYYINKFLEILPAKQFASLDDEGWVEDFKDGFNKAIDEATTAIKNLNKEQP